MQVLVGAPPILNPPVVVLLNKTVVPLQIVLLLGVLVKLASGGVCIFIGPKALLLVPHGLDAVIDA